MTQREDFELAQQAAEIAQLIRVIDGNHDLSASTLAEGLVGNGVGMTKKTVKLCCLAMLQMASQRFGQGRLEAGHTLTDAAQELAAIAGVDLTLDLTGMPIKDQQRADQQRHEQQAKAAQKQPKPVLKQKGKRGKSRGRA